MLCPNSPGHLCYGQGFNLTETHSFYDQPFLIVALIRSVHVEARMNSFIQKNNDK